MTYIIICVQPGRLKPPAAQLTNFTPPKGVYMQALMRYFPVNRWEHLHVSSSALILKHYELIILILFNELVDGIAPPARRWIKVIQDYEQIPIR